MAMTSDRPKQFSLIMAGLAYIGAVYKNLIIDLNITLNNSISGW